ARTVLAASALHDPADDRARSLGEALQYLGRRIDAMLDASAVPVAGIVAEMPAVPATHAPADAKNENGSAQTSDDAVAIDAVCDVTAIDAANDDDVVAIDANARAGVIDPDADVVVIDTDNAVVV